MKNILLLFVSFLFLSSTANASLWDKAEEPSEEVSEEVSVDSDNDADEVEDVTEFER